MTKKPDLPKKGELWIRWDTLVTILGVIESGLVGIQLVQFMTPDGHQGAVDSRTWRANMLDGFTFAVAKRDEIM